MKKGDIVELIKNTKFYKKGKRAVVVCEYDRQNGNEKKITIRYEGERYYGEDADVMPKELFKIVS